MNERARSGWRVGCVIHSWNSQALASLDVLAMFTPEHTTPLLTPAQAGEYLRTNPRTLANWRVRGAGPAYCRVGRRPFYRLEELDAFIEAGRVSHRAEERVRVMSGGRL